MKSSSGIHHVGLDHIRALAVFLVFTYHFLIAAGGRATPLEGSDAFFANALLAEGHTGVGLFMTLSGYLFARLTEGRQLHFAPFFRNRLLRLAPLLGVVIAYRLWEFWLEGAGVFRQALSYYATGFFYPSWPNGGWSIATELHFYALLPVLLAVTRRDPRWLLIVVAAALAGRTIIWALWGGETLELLAYWTIVGRIDQFVLGILAARCGAWLGGRHFLAASVALGWAVVWSTYARVGGFYGDGGAGWIWIGLTTCEGTAYALLIAWYDRSFRMPATGVSGVIARIGEWSFSIYLLHFFFVDRLAVLMTRTILPTRDFDVAVLLSLPCFALAALVGWFVYERFEKPFLSRRAPYLDRPEEDAVGSAVAACCAGVPYPQRCGRCREALSAPTA